MKKSNKLDFSSERKKNLKKLKYFLISFSIFIVILGTVSLLMFMRSLDFDLSNLVKSETTTEATSEVTTQEVKMSGKYDIVFLCNDSSNNISFAFVISSDMDNKTIRICNLDASTVSVANNTTATYAEHFKKYGITGLVHAVEDYSGITLERYIKVDETQFKSLVSKIGDVTVTVPSALDAKATGGLSLDAGEQQLSGDLLLRYIKYCDAGGKADSFTAFIKKVFSTSNINSQDALFSYLVNNSQTNITIVDYTNRKYIITAFVRTGGIVEKIDGLEQISEVGNEEKD